MFLPFALPYYYILTRKPEWLSICVLVSFMFSLLVLKGVPFLYIVFREIQDLFITSILTKLRTFLVVQLWKTFLIGKPKICSTPSRIRLNFFTVFRSGPNHSTRKAPNSFKTGREKLFLYFSTVNDIWHPLRHST